MRHTVFPPPPKVLLGLSGENRTCHTKSPGNCESVGFMSLY